MDGNFEQFGGGGQDRSPAQSSGVAALDWPGLAARLVAAHAARAVLNEPTGAVAGASGSFAPALARHLAASRRGQRVSSPGVNQTAKGDRKAPRTIGRHGTSAEEIAVRGLL